MQAHVRGHREYSYYTSLQKAAIVTQCGWRQRVARRELRKLRMVLINPFLFHSECQDSCSTLYDFLSFYGQASRETGALKEAKDKLEKKVEELTWRVQFEKRLRVKSIFANLSSRLLFIYST